MGKSMWTTLPLALALSLAAGQAASPLTLANDRVTYGLLGAPRPDTKFLPGDRFLLAFDIENITIDKGGRIRYAMGMEVTDSNGKTHYRQDPRDLEAYNSLGGNRLPAFAHVDIGLDQPPGMYTLKVTVKDRATKTERALTRKFEVLKKDFGLVQLNTTSDPQGQMPAAPVGVVGQSLWVNFAAVGFDRKNKQPDVHVEMRVYDENNKPTVPEPFTGDVNQGVPADLQALPMQFLLALNRPGKYTVKLRASDKVAKKNVEITFPVTVLELK
jgi:hypothetical protein